MAESAEDSKKGDGDVLLAGAVRSSSLATAIYTAICLGHLGLLVTHLELKSSADPRFFGALAIVEVALAAEVLIFAVGAFGRPGSFITVLSIMGRIRLLGAAIAWPWLVPWVVELGCRGQAISLGEGVFFLHLTQMIAAIISGYLVLREVVLLFGWEPPAALEEAAPAQLGDCLPGQAVFGGHFRLDKADLEETGRAVFVPAKPRSGLYIGAGLALLVHLILAPRFASTGSFPPWQALGAISAVAGRWFGQLPKFKSKKDREPNERFDHALLWKREAARLICRFGELLWVAFCLLELQRREASPEWLSSCSAA